MTWFNTYGKLHRLELLVSVPLIKYGLAQRPSTLCRKHILTCCEEILANNFETLTGFKTTWPLRIPIHTGPNAWSTRANFLWHFQYIRDNKFCVENSGACLCSRNDFGLWSPMIRPSTRRRRNQVVSRGPGNHCQHLHIIVTNFLCRVVHMNNLLVSVFLPKSRANHTQGNKHGCRKFVTENFPLWTRLKSLIWILLIRIHYF